VPDLGLNRIEGYPMTGNPSPYNRMAPIRAAPSLSQTPAAPVTPATGDLPLALQLNPPEQQSPIFQAGCGSWCRDNCTIYGEPCCVLSWNPPVCGCC